MKLCEAGKPPPDASHLYMLGREELAHDGDEVGVDAYSRYVGDSLVRAVVVIDLLYQARYLGLGVGTREGGEVDGAVEKFLDL